MNATTTGTKRIRRFQTHSMRHRKPEAQLQQLQSFEDPAPGAVGRGDNRSLPLGLGRRAQVIRERSHDTRALEVVGCCEQILVVQCEQFWVGSNLRESLSDNRGSQAEESSDFVIESLWSSVTLPRYSLQDHSVHERQCGVTNMRETEWL